jgi:ketosteroid isomerase-like protein
MNNLYTTVPASLLETLAAFDETFSQDRGSDMGAFFSPHARLMWPGIEDIVGRDAVRFAFEQLVATFTTISWRPEWTTIEVFGDRAISIGRFTEDRAPRAGGPSVRVFGRLVELWSLDPQGKWTIDIALTSRYAEDQPLG